MSGSRIENSIKNSIIAIIFKILQIVLPFITRTLVIKLLGISYVGISSLFTSILGLLGIAELGIGSAMLHALYEPIEKKETERINAIINFYRKAYGIIGVVILTAGSALTPFLKHFIKTGTYPDNLNLYYIYAINLFCTIITYLVYSYKSLLLEAHQLGREVNKVRIRMTFISYSVQVLVLLLTKNYYFFISLLPITNIISAVWVAKIADKLFPQYKPVGTISGEEKKSIFEDVKSLFLYKIGGVVFNSIDNAVISLWFGAVVLGIYNNYYYIVSSVSTILLAIYEAVLPSFGSSAVGVSVEQNYKNFMKIAFLDSYLNGWCSICLYCLFPPFINMWIGEEGNLGQSYALLFAIYFLCWRLLDPVSLYKDALGLWRMDKWRPLLTAILNLVLNILLTMTIGLCGILLSSIISVLVVSYPFSVKCLFKYFGRSVKTYYAQMLKVTVSIFISGAITKIICCRVNLSNEMLNFMTMIVICIMIPNLICFVAFRNNEGLQMIVNRVKSKEEK